GPRRCASGPVTFALEPVCENGPEEHPAGREHIVMSINRPVAINGYAQYPSPFDDRSGRRRAGADGREAPADASGRTTRALCGGLDRRGGPPGGPPAPRGPAPPPPPSPAPPPLDLWAPPPRPPRV